jgi:hypothetical protein
MGLIQKAYEKVKQTIINKKEDKGTIYLKPSESSSAQSLASKTGASVVSVSGSVSSPTTTTLAKASNTSTSYGSSNKGTIYFKPSESSSAQSLANKTGADVAVTSGSVSSPTTTTYRPSTSASQVQTKDINKGTIYLKEDERGYASRLAQRTGAEVIVGKGTVNKPEFETVTPPKQYGVLFSSGKEAKALREQGVPFYNLDSNVSTLDTGEPQFLTTVPSFEYYPTSSGYVRGQAQMLQAKDAFYGVDKPQEYYTVLAKEQFYNLPKSTKAKLEFGEATTGFNKAVIGVTEGGVRIYNRLGKEFLFGGSLDKKNRAFVEKDFSFKGDFFERTKNAPNKFGMFGTQSLSGLFVNVATFGKPTLNIAKSTYNVAKVGVNEFGSKGFFTATKDMGKSIYKQRFNIEEGVAELSPLKWKAETFGGENLAKAKFNTISRNVGDKRFTVGKSLTGRTTLSATEIKGTDGIINGVINTKQKLVEFTSTGRLISKTQYTATSFMGGKGLTGKAISGGLTSTAKAVTLNLKTFQTGGVIPVVSKSTTTFTSTPELKQLRVTIGNPNKAFLSKSGGGTRTFEKFSYSESGIVKPQYKYSQEMFNNKPLIRGSQSGKFMGEVRMRGIELTGGSTTGSQGGITFTKTGSSSVGRGFTGGSTTGSQGGITFTKTGSSSVGRGFTGGSTTGSQGGMKIMQDAPKLTQTSQQSFLGAVRIQPTSSLVSSTSQSIIALPTFKTSTDSMARTGVRSKTGLLQQISPEQKSMNVPMFNTGIKAISQTKTRQIITPITTQTPELKTPSRQISPITFNPQPLVNRIRPQEPLPPITPPPFLFKLPFGGERNKGLFDVKASRKYSYAPSFKAIVFGIKSTGATPSASKRWTGLETRGITKGSWFGRLGKKLKRRKKK